MIGTQVGNYRIVLKVAQDNLGILYNAEHFAGQPVLLRQFAAEFTDGPSIGRYFDLARLAGSLNHPGIWNVHEVVWAGNSAFVIGDRLPVGISLDQILERDGKLWPELTVKLGWQLASAMGAAHAIQSYHLRFDCDSVLVHPDELAPGGYRMKIMDFGVAAFVDAGPPDWNNPRVDAFGLPFYMPPEQLGGMLGYHGDVYGLGCVLYHMAVGRPPFVGQRPQDLADAHRQLPPEPIRALDNQLPPELDALINLMLTKEPTARPTMPEVAYELERIAKQYWSAPTRERTIAMGIDEPEPPSRFPLKVVAAVLAAMALLGVVFALVNPFKKAPPPPPPKVEEAAPEPPRAPPLPAYKPPEEKPLEKASKIARAHIEEGRFPEAQEALKAALAIDPNDPEVARMARSLKNEPANKKLFDDFMKSADEKDPVKAQKKLAKIPADSVFADKGKTIMAQVKKDFLHVKLAEAKALHETKTCGKLPRLEKEVASVFPDSTEEFASLTRTCSK